MYVFSKLYSLNHSIDIIIRIILFNSEVKQIYYYLRHLMTHTFGYVTKDKMIYLEMSYYLRRLAVSELTIK